MLLIFPTGRFLPGRWGGAGKAAVAVMVLSGLVVLVAPSEDRLDADLPPGVDPDPTTLSALEGMDWLVGVAVAVGAADDRRPDADRGGALPPLPRDRAGPDALAALGRARDGVLGRRSGLALPDLLPGWLLTFLVMVLPALAMTVAVVNPTLVSIAGPARPHPAVRRALAGHRARSTSPCSAGCSALLDDSLADREVVLVVLLRDRRCSTRPLRSLVRRRGAAAGARRPGQPVRRRGRAGVDPGDRRRGPGPARRGRPRGRAGVRDRLRERRGRPHRRRAAGRHPRRAPGRRPAPCRSPTATRRSAGWCCRRAGCAAGCRRRDEQLLGDLVRQAATAARTSRLADELQESRERLVVTREEERRRIRRDLHDGLGPALSGVVFQLESARLLVDQDPGGRQGQDRRDQRATCRTSSPTYAGWCTTCGRRRSTTAAWSARCASRPSSSRPAARRPRSRPTSSERCPRRSRWRRTGSPARRWPTSPGTPGPRPASYGCGSTDAALVVEVADDGRGIARRRRGRRRPGVAARAGGRARRPQRGHLSRRAAARSCAPGYP